MMVALLVAVSNNVMSLEKAIQHKKEYRKPYYDSRRFDYHCRNNGKCSYCVNNRTHKNKRREYNAKDECSELEGS